MHIDEPEADPMQSERKWRFQRTLSLDSLLAVCGATIAVIFFATTLDKRLSIMENKYDELAKIIERNEQGQKERANRIEETVRDQARQIQQLIAQPPRR